MKPFLEPYVWSKLGEYKEGTRVQVIGKIEKTEDEVAVFRSGEEKKTLIFPKGEEIGKVKKMELIRVFGTSTNGEIKVDFIQDMTGLDLDKYLKVKRLEDM